MPKDESARDRDLDDHVLASRPSKTTKSNFHFDTSPATPSQDHIRCSVCAKLGRILDCCNNVSVTCSLCADLDHILTQQRQEVEVWKTHCDGLTEKLKTLQEDPEKRAQEKSDLIESLRRQTHEADKEDKRLAKILEERKQTLKGLQAQQMVWEGPQEFTIRETKKKGKKGKR